MTVSLRTYLTHMYESLAQSTGTNSSLLGRSFYRVIIIPSENGHRDQFFPCTRTSGGPGFHDHVLVRNDKKLCSVV